MAILVSNYFISMTLFINMQAHGICLSSAMVQWLLAMVQWSPNSDEDFDIVKSKQVIRICTVRVNQQRCLIHTWHCPEHIIKFRYTKNVANIRLINHLQRHSHVTPAPNHLMNKVISCNTFHLKFHMSLHSDMIMPGRNGFLLRCPLT